MITYLLEASLLLAVFYLGYHLLLRNDTFFQRNRLYLLGTLLESLLFPLLKLPNWFAISDSVSVRNASSEAASIYLNLAEVGTAVSDTEIAFGFKEAFLLIAALIGIRYGWQYAQLVFLIAKSPKKWWNGYRLVDTQGKLSFSSFFQYLLWDGKSDLHSEEVKTILRHEQAHIKGWHSLDMFLIKAAKTFFWFHPALWMLEKEMYLQHEFLADEYAYNNTSTEVYKTILIKEIFRQNDLLLVQSFSQKSSLKKRITMMNTPKSNLLKQTKLALLIPFLAGSVWFVACNEQDEAMPSQGELMKKEYSQKLEMEKNLKLLEELAEQSKQNKENTNGAMATRDQVDQMPVFGKENSNGNGFYELQAFLSENLKYPDRAKETGKTGRVFVSFVVSKDGSLKDIEVVKSVSEELDQAAIEAVKSMNGMWTPGSDKGEPKDVKMVLPFSFKL